MTAATQSRLDRLRAALDAPALLLTDSLNISYMTAMTGLIDAEDPHVVLITPDAAVLLTDSRYSETAREQAAAVAAATATPAASPWQIVEFSATRPAAEEVIGQLAHHKVTAVALEDTLSHRRYQDWTRRLADRGITVQESSGLVEALRRCKDASELEAIAAAQAITDAAFTQMLGFMQPGMREIDIASELEYRMRKLGATGLAFESIIAAGPNGAKPHALPSARAIEPGDLLVMDFGAAKDGYCSDMTRTVAFGDPGAEAREVYAVVLAAQQAGLDAARAGQRGRDVHEAAREVIARAGYGERFGHGLSHGLGMLVHETPHCSPRSTDTLAPGDVISMEPGIYLPGRFGVRIEDLIAITPGGVRNFTTSPKELTIL
ncbi:MAG: aminopeptidase P family protein [Coriobacteriia bacterium]|nr:aminopeptidase P family protein [Coriobacteriia bacterium]